MCRCSKELFLHGKKSFGEEGDKRLVDVNSPSVGRLGMVIDRAAVPSSGRRTVFIVSSSLTRLTSSAQVTMASITLRDGYYRFRISNFAMG